MSENSLNDIIYELNMDFSADELSKFFANIGFAPMVNCVNEESFDRFVFLHGDKDEVYGTEERRFIEKVGTICVYTDFLKKTARGKMKCYTIAADVSEIDDSLYSAILFMKIVIKAKGGFPIFILKLEDGIHIGCRLFDSKEWNNCILSDNQKPISFIDDSIWLNDTIKFLDYYTSIVDILKPESNNYMDYDEAAIKRRGIQSSYIDSLRAVQDSYGTSTQTAMENYYDYFEEDNSEEDFISMFNECMDELRNIKSSKVNTIEMLFEADEIERMAIEADVKQSKLAEESVAQPEGNVDEDILKQMKSDPEQMLKKLKNLHGLS